VERFELVRALGSGVSGTVYEAFDRKHQARVALKLLHGRSGDPLVRFKREFRVLQGLHHPNLVSFGELFSDGDEWFFTMELLAGADFRAYVRPHDERDDVRIRAALRQVAEALGALHAAGIVHRDVKPANVVLSYDGRATLLDFGVVKDPRSPSQSSPELVSFVGTPGYMAPEQISGDAAPPADCYAAGVMLYEALVGRLPFMGKVADVLQAKQLGPPEAPIAIDPTVPLDLNDLALDLLALDPSVRPTAEDIAGRLPRVRTSSVPPSARARAFVGRAPERAALHLAADAVRAGEARVVILEGESGIGKTALARQAIAELRVADPRALVLEGRCRETEWIPYKAFDGPIEALAELMRSLSPAEAAVLLPLRASLVAQAFPALVRAAPTAFARARRASDVDLVRQRLLLFSAVRELFARVASRRTLVLFIDDLQWADADSFALLSEVTRGPDAPPMLVLATVREAGALPVTLRAERLRVGPLEARDAAELARRLAARSDATAAIDPQAVAREADGHPLFVTELVAHAVRATPDARAPRLDDAIAARIALLDAHARELLECIALAARPATRAVLARATSLEGNDTYRLANELCAASLVRVCGEHADKLEPFHDRVRNAVLRALDEPRTIKRHRRIAAALEFGDERDAEALAYHWHAAKKSDRAAPYAEEAAAEAERAFAFDQAARHWRMALDAVAADRREALLVRLGDALAHAGRSVEAAAAYGDAAAIAREPEVHLQRAADQLLRAGRIEEGLALAYAVLARLGISAPSSPWIALASFLFWRCVFAARGLSFREQSAADVTPRTLAKIDTTWSLTSALGTIDPIRGAYFQMRHLRMALRAGEPYRVVRAAALQIGYSAGPGADAWLRNERFAARCTALSARIGDPHGVALTELASGIACYLQGRFARSIELLDDAERRLRACPGTWGEIVRARRFALSALACLGRMRELRSRVYVQLRDAREHGDLHAMTSLRIGHPNLVWLMEDDADAARAEIDEAMQTWSLRDFQLEHHYALLAATNVDLYAGDAERAHARQKGAWPRLRRSFLLRIPAARIVAASSRARTAIALAARGPSNTGALLAEAERLARSVAREPLPFAAPTSDLLRAAIAWLSGHTNEARVHAWKAEDGFRRLDMRLLAAAARRRRGELLDDDALVHEADAWMRAEEISAPSRMTAMLAPGIGRSTETGTETP
jgi:hypothetical protein